MYIYQPDKYQETYEATFRIISGKYFNNIHSSIILEYFCLDLMASYGVDWKPGFRMNADWELAERNAWRSVFGDVPLDGCLFHFGNIT